MTGKRVRPAAGVEARAEPVVAAVPDGAGDDPPRLGWLAGIR